jgi:hypothetical protein
MTRAQSIAHITAVRGLPTGIGTEEEYTQHSIFSGNNFSDLEGDEIYLDISEAPPNSRFFERVPHILFFAL